MSLSADDVREILALVDKSAFNEMRLETDRFKLYLRRRDGSMEVVETVNVPVSAPPEVTTKPRETASAAPPGSIDISAPIPGTFYRAPKPGADPFVTVGAHVAETTVVGIIEVMKLMNSIPAGLRGEIVEICAQDGEPVVTGQILFRVKSSS